MKTQNIEKKIKPDFLQHAKPARETDWVSCIIGLLIAIGFLIYVLSW